MPAPLCTCGHDELTHGGEPGCPPTWCHNDDCDCIEYTPPGSLEDILGVWRDQGPFPLSHTADVALLVDEIVRLRALVLTTAARATADAHAHIDDLVAELRRLVHAADAYMHGRDVPTGLAGDHLRDAITSALGVLDEATA